jgi:hypothetical protein
MAIKITGLFQGWFFFADAVQGIGKELLSWVSDLLFICNIRVCRNKYPACYNKTSEE